MQLETIQYLREEWSVKSFPDLDSENTLILVFSAPEFISNAKPIEELARHYPKSKIIGCSGAGEIFGTKIFDKSISVAIVKFEKSFIQVVKTEIDAMDESFKVGEKISQELNSQDLKGIFVLSDGLKVNGSELAKGLNSIQNEKVVITGGLAGDGNRFKETWSIFNGEIFKNHVIGVGIYGDHIQIGHGSRGGWDIFGPERRITRSINNVLYELDGKPVLELYKQYLGERAIDLPAAGLLYPLAIRKDSRDERQLVRTILAVDEKEQSLTFAGDMPMGYLAQLMRANFDRLITAADEAGELATKRMQLKENNKDLPVLAIAVSCVGRRLLLGERTEEETESISDALLPNTQLIGFYSYGELSPYATGNCDLHNQTMTLTTVCET